MRRLILHIGAHKTGSTSIQQTLYASRKYLQQQGVCYTSRLMRNHNLSFAPIFKKDISKFYSLAKALGNSDPEKKQKTFRTAWTKILERNNSKNFVISGESLSLLDREAVAAVYDFVAPWFDDISVIIYIRPPKSFVSSSIQEIIKNGNRVMPFDKVLKQSKRCGYLSAVKRWVDVFGQKNVTVRNYDIDLLKNNDVVDDFLDACGFTGVDIGKLSRVWANMSLGMNTIAFMNEFNQKYPSIEAGAVNKIRSAMPMAVFRAIAEPKFSLDIKFDQAEADKLNSDIEYVNQFIVEGYQLESIEASDEPTVVPDPNDIPIQYFADLINEYNKYIYNNCRTYLRFRKFISDPRRYLPHPIRYVKGLFGSRSNKNKA